MIASASKRNCNNIWHPYDSDKYWNIYTVTIKIPDNSSKCFKKTSLVSRAIFAHEALCVSPEAKHFKG